MFGTRWFGGLVDFVYVYHGQAVSCLVLVEGSKTAQGGMMPCRAN